MPVGAKSLHLRSWPHSAAWRGMTRRTHLYSIKHVRACSPAIADDACPRIGVVQWILQPASVSSPEPLCSFR
jgi:hypothetical protein